MRGRIERILAGRGNRARRQAGVAVGVVGRIELQIVAPQVAVVAAGALQRVDDRRIALQPHADPQPVGVDRGDERPLVGARRSPSRRSTPASPTAARVRPRAARPRRSAGVSTWRKRSTIAVTSLAASACRGHASRCPGTDSPRGRSACRIEVSDAVALPAAAATNAAAVPSPCASNDCRPSRAMVSPSGKVMRTRSTSPRAILSTTSARRHRPRRSGTRRPSAAGRRRSARPQPVGQPSRARRPAAMSRSPMARGPEPAGISTSCASPS